MELLVYKVRELKRKPCLKFIIWKTGGREGLQDV